eukprot:387954_1
MESNVLIASNPFGISFKDLLLGRIKAEGDLRREWICTKVGEKIEIKDGDNRFVCGMMGGGMGMRRRRRLGLSTGEVEMSASGDGDLELKFGYIFRFIVGVRFKFLANIYTIY